MDPPAHGEKYCPGGDPPSFSRPDTPAVLCDAALGMGGVRKTSEDECLTTDCSSRGDHRKAGDTAPCFFTRWKTSLYTQCSRAWLIPTTAARAW